MHGKRFGVTSVEVPLPLPRFRIRAVMTKAAAMDAGVAWLFGMLSKTAPVTVAARKKAAKASRRR